MAYRFLLGKLGGLICAEFCRVKGVAHRARVFLQLGQDGTVFRQGPGGTAGGRVVVHHAFAAVFLQPALIRNCGKLGNRVSGEALAQITLGHEKGKGQVLRLILSAAAAGAGDQLSRCDLAAALKADITQVGKNGVIGPAVLRGALQNQSIAQTLPVPVGPPHSAVRRGIDRRPLGHGDIQTPVAVLQAAMLAVRAAFVAFSAEKTGLCPAAAVPVGDIPVILLIQREKPRTVVPAEDRAALFAAELKQGFLCLFNESFRLCRHIRFLCRRSHLFNRKDYAAFRLVRRRRVFPDYLILGKNRGRKQGHKQDQTQKKRKSSFGCFLHFTYLNSLNPFFSIGILRISQLSHIVKIRE